MEQFFTREVGNRGRKFFLSLPTGEITEHWVVIRSVDSDEFRLTDSEVRRELLSLVDQDDNKDKSEKVEELVRKTVASLIADWSFDQECTMENRMKFLKEAPQIQDMVNRLSAQRKVFFVEGSNGSSSGLNPHSDSTAQQQKDQS